MRVAIQLSGQPRFTIAFQSFLENLIGYDRADWFVYITNNNFQKGKINVDVPESWKTFNTEWAINKIKINIPNNNYLQSFEISNDHEQSWPAVSNLHSLSGENTVARVFNMFYNIYKTNQLRLNYQKDNNVEYDFIIRIRPDINVDSNIDLKNIKIENNEIVMPNNNWFGYEAKSMIVNDMFAIGTSDSMNIYSDLVNFIKKYNDEGIRFHPETLLAYHLHINDIKTTRGNFKSEIIRSPFLNNWC